MMTNNFTHLFKICEKFLYHLCDANRKISQLNFELFEARPVLSYYEHGILINTEYLPNRPTNFVISSTSLPVIPIVVAQHPVVETPAIVVHTQNN